MKLSPNWRSIYNVDTGFGSFEVEGQRNPTVASTSSLEIQFQHSGDKAVKLSECG